VRVPVERGTGRVSQALKAWFTLALVETKKEISEFLTSRRGRITPEQAGLATYGSRRVPGLRREEVAVLAGVSAPYYTRLERGDMSGASEGVLEALARALQLDDAERAHLFDLARAAQPTAARPRRRQAKPRIRPEVQWTLDAITGAAAYVGNDRLDILATNELGRALFSEIYAMPSRPPNHARFVFLDPRAEAFYGDWDRAARETAAILRSAAGRDPHDRDLSDLVGELATQSEAFRIHWAAHNVRFHSTAVKHLNHPVVGELSLSFNRLDIAADHGLTMFTYAAEPGSRSEEALNLLGSWAATLDPAESARPTSRS
jgi:transcriptional regulator with XRE-family HTH domain